VHNKKVWPRELKEGNLVLRKIFPLLNEDRSKKAPNYEDSYMVKKTFSCRALLLANMDRKDVIRPINSDSEKKYFLYDVSILINKAKFWPRILFVYSCLFYN
jgi:hypothetical protein